MEVTTWRNDLLFADDYTGPPPIEHPAVSSLFTRRIAGFGGKCRSVPLRMGFPTHFEAMPTPSDVGATSSENCKIRKMMVGFPNISGSVFAFVTAA
ncbi:MAG: hypothetical protein CMJ77_16840 [Planctomycetaceae bacterium]|nr:hypothetical protein [Planctomycetaceae bacterium]